MLEKGGTVSEFEQYIPAVLENIYLDEPLRKIGNISDYIDFNNQKVVRNVGYKVFDGDESWDVYKNVDSNWNIYSLNLNNVKERTILSNYFEFDELNSNVFKTGISIDSSISKVLVQMNISTLDEFKIWLNSNNVEVQYPLSQPLEKKLKLPKIPVVESKYIKMCSLNGVCGSVESELNY